MDTPKETPTPSILGTDGQPHPEGTVKQQESMTSEQFCAGVLSAYLDQMAQNGIDPVNALLQMGRQVPSAMIQFIQFHTDGLTAPAEEPLKVLLEKTSEICRKFGFRMMFQLSYAGEPEGEQDDGRDGCCSGCDCGNECTDECKSTCGDNCCDTSGQGDCAETTDSGGSPVRGSGDEENQSNP